MLAKFVVDSHFRLQAKGASLDEKSFTDSQDDDRVTMAAFDPEVVLATHFFTIYLNSMGLFKSIKVSFFTQIIPQELIKKYLTYAKLNVFPKLHDAYLDKLTQVYVEPRRESSVRLPFIGAFS
ncbi:DNA replication licensing factor MCM2 isoform X1 [Capsicum annuum]